MKSSGLKFVPVFIATVLFPLWLIAEEMRSEFVTWGWVSTVSSNPVDAAMLANQREFLHRYPLITPKIGGGPQLQRFGRGTREFLMSQAGGVAPDVVEMSDVDLQDFTSRNFLQPLDSFFRLTGQREEVFKQTLSKQFTRDGHVYALPGTPGEPIARTYVLVYRKDIFRRAGLDPEKPPRNWDELLKCLESITSSGEGHFGMVLPTIEGRGIGAGAFIELIFALNGARILHEDAKRGWTAEFAEEPRAIEAIEFVRELIGRRMYLGSKEIRGVISTSAGMVDDAIMLSQGKTAMIIQPIEELPWHVSRGIPASEIGVALLPLGPSGIASSEGFVPMTARYLGVNSLSPSNRQKAAWEWVWFHQRAELAQLRIKAYVDAGWTMFLDPRDVEADPKYAAFVSDIPEQWQKVWRTMMDRARPLPMCPQHRQLRQDYLARPVWALLADPDADLRQLLRDTEKAINEELLGHVPPAVQQRRRSIGLIAVALVCIGLLAGGWLVVRGLMRGLAPRSTGAAGTQVGRGRAYFIASVMMLPAVLSVMLWAYLPLARGGVMAFQDYQIAGNSAWVGVDNFVSVLTDPLFWISLWRTIQYAALTLSLGFVAPIALAFLLAEVPRFKVPLRVIYCLPAMTSSLVILFFWKWMYEPGENGLFNAMIRGVGSWFGQTWGPFKWLDSEGLAMLSVVLPGVWAGLGVGSIIYLAALGSVPDEMYEAADLDGAGAWHKVWHIALPHIKPLIIINFVGTFIGTFQAMQNVFVTTGGGPGDATYLVGLYIFLNSFVWLQFGKATAAAWIVGSLLIGFTVFQLRLLRNLKFQAASDNAREA